MKKLILINGTMGAGKTAVCSGLNKKLNESVWLDGDWCWMMNPFKVTEENKAMVISNITYMLRNFLNNSGFQYVIFDWVMHQESIINDILNKLEGVQDFKTYKLTLICSEAKLRKRILKDVQNGVRDIEVLERSIARLYLYEDMDTIKINTDNIDVEGVVHEIMGIVNDTDTYADTKNFWDKAFERVPEYDPNEQLPVPRIETALSWLVSGTESVIDFGCGNGKVLFRCLSKGTSYVYGIDISDTAVKNANEVKESFNYKNKAEFICGGLEKLEKIKDSRFGGAVLFNILDNIIPEDADRLINNIHRITKPEGRILLKLNPYITMEEIKEYGLEKISDGFYKDTSGPYLYNLTNEKAEKIFSPYFNIKKYEEIEFKGNINRIYYLVNKE